MRYARHSALIRVAAMAVAPLGVLAPFCTPVSSASEPAASDDLYVNACSAIDDGSTSDAESDSVAPSVPAATPPPAVTSGDDLFVQLAAPTATDGATAVTVTQSQEVVPAPSAFTPLEPAPPAGTGLNRPIVMLTLDAAANPELVANLSKLKTDVAIRDESIDRFGSWDDPTREAASTPSRFNPQLVSWAAPAVYTNPLYFEQPNVERYGHYVGVCQRDNLTQSAISAAHFFVCVPALPYKIGAEGPCECNYTLGSYRPGSCNPHQLVKPPLSLRGLVFEGAAATGLVFLLP